ncbi:MAG: sugar ABC transporter substrate-binding protein [Geminicoccaceae bacterium]|nr:MAG: sugar ABC transporter substrate-binding protein [Geminicoccaceae bacterium]
MRILVTLAAATAALLAAPGPAAAVKLGIVAFQMSAETHARTANAAKAAAEDKGWEVTLLNSAGSVPDHAAQIENLVQKGVDAILLAMGKPLQAEAQLVAAAAKKIPVVTVMSGTSPHTLFDVTVNEFEVGAKIGVYLLGLMNYQGNILMSRYEGHGGTKIRGRVMDIILEENTGVKVLGTHSMARTQSWREDVKAGMEALILRHGGQFQAVWASFDGQAFVIDDILQAQGYKKGQVFLTGVDGGQEAFRRIRDPNSLLTATVAIPFELMGEAAVDALDDILSGTPKNEITPGPYLFMDAVLVDANNVPAEGEWPW